MLNNYVSQPNNIMCWRPCRGSGRQ